MANGACRHVIQEIHRAWQVSALLHTVTSTRSNNPPIDGITCGKNQGDAGSSYRMLRDRSPVIIRYWASRLVEITVRMCVQDRLQPVPSMHELARAANRTCTWFFLPVDLVEIGVFPWCHASWAHDVLMGFNGLDEGRYRSRGQTASVLTSPKELWFRFGFVYLGNLCSSGQSISCRIACVSYLVNGSSVLTHCGKLNVGPYPVCWRIVVV